MPFVLVRHRVEDFDRWKPFFESHEGVRQEIGLRVAQLMRNADDPQEVLILFEASDLEKARGMTQSDELRQIMEKAGVLGRPSFDFLNSAG
jgi:hypothetical protein